MDIKEIRLLYSNRLIKSDLFDNHEYPTVQFFDYISWIGVPDIVLNKFEPCKRGVMIDKLVFSKSRVSDIYLGVEISSSQIVCFSKSLDTYSFMNTDYERFIRTNFAYETFKTICVGSKTYGEYYDNTPSGGNFEKYSEVLKELISSIDERASKEGVWYSLIQEMSMGVI